MILVLRGLLNKIPIAGGLSVSEQMARSEEQEGENGHFIHDLLTSWFLNKVHQGSSRVMRSSLSMTTSSWLGDDVHGTLDQTKSRNVSSYVIRCLKDYGTQSLPRP